MKTTIIKSNFTEDKGLHYKDETVPLKTNILTNWNKEWILEFWINFFVQGSQIKGNM